MNVLLLTPSLPYPAHQGGALRNLGILHGLATSGHRITLLSFADTSEPDVGPLRDWCQRIEIVPAPARRLADRVRDLALTQQPDMARRLESAAFRQRLAGVLTADTFDIVQFEGLEMAIYLEAARKQQPQARLIYDAHNAEAALQAAIASVAVTSHKGIAGAIYSRIQAARIARMEQAVCQQADAVIAVSQHDADALGPFRADRQIFVLPNGIFADEYAAVSTLDLGRSVLVFTGKMDYRPNVDAMHWFVSQILPRISERVPATQLYIVGQKPHRSIAGFGDLAHVQITGWVPSVQPFLGAADVYVAPLRMGSGTRLKILEAMAAGRAVVATSIAASGLSAEAIGAIRIADDAAAFAEAVIALLNDTQAREHLGVTAQKIMREQYDWTALIPCLLDFYRTVTRV